MAKLTIRSGDKIIYETEDPTEIERFSKNIRELEERKKDFKNKYYLLNKISKYPTVRFEEGKTIYFEMPPFCSGDYEAKIYKDNIGLYINFSDNFFEGCRDFIVK